MGLQRRDSRAVTAPTGPACPIPWRSGVAAASGRGGVDARGLGRVVVGVGARPGETSGTGKATGAPAQAGVPHVWLVDPLAQSVECFTLDGPTYRLTAVVGTDERVRLPPFDAVELDLAVLWRR